MRNEYTIDGERVLIKLGRRNDTPIDLIIDLADLPKMEKVRRVVHQGGRSDKSYAIAYFYDDSTIMVHRFLNDTAEDERCVFTNGNGFDCRRSNLQNMKEVALRLKSWRKKPNPDRYIQKRHPYIVVVQDKDERHYVGGFWTKKDARTARNKFLKKLGAE